MIGEKWVSLVIGALDSKVMRFGELKRVCAGISQKMLTQTLRKLERNGLIIRTVYAETLPLRVEYRLAKLGEGVLPIVQAARVWAEANLHEIEAQQRLYDQATRSTSTQPAPQER